VYCVDVNRSTRLVALEKQEQNLTNMKTKGNGIAVLSERGTVNC